jgi:transposase
MRGPKPKYSIKLINNEITELHQLVNSRKASQGKAMRARIILAAHEHPEWSNQQIAKAVGCSDRVVRTWRHRWVENKNLDDLPRPGAPRRFSP